MRKNWCHDVVVINATQLHSTKPKLKFCVGPNPTSHLFQPEMAAKYHTSQKIIHNSVKTRGRNKFFCLTSHF